MARKKTKKKRKSGFEAKMEAFGKRMENKHKKESRHKGLGFGLFLFIIGLIWLGNDLGWWKPALPLWPTILVVFGGVIVLSELLKALKR